MKRPAVRPPNWRSALDLLTAGLLVAALPHLWRLPTWVYPLFALLLGGLWLLRRTGRDGLPWFLNWLLGALGFTLVFINFHALWGLEAGTALLLLLTALKVAEIRQKRDVVIAVYLGFFLVLTVLLFDQSLLMALYLLGAILLLTMVLARISDASGGQTLVYQARMAGSLLLLSLPLMLLLFVIFPRLPGPLWALPEPENQAVSGLSGSMSPGDITSLVLSAKPAFRVRFEGDLPEQSRLYWRGPVLSRFDGVRWEASQTETRNAKPLQPSSADGNLVNYQLLLEPTGRRWVFALEMPAAAPPGAALDPVYQIISDKRLDEAAGFQLSANLDRRPWAAENPALLDRLRRLPAGFAPRARTLAAELRRSRSEEVFVRTVLDYFNRQPFAYTLRPQPLTGDRVDSFLFDTREGYCEHYASSFTVLMRAAGIPARVVTGYQGGEWNDLGDYLLVRQSEAHAWSEVWLDGRGWVRVDPTVAVAPERIRDGVGAALPEEALLPLVRRSDFGGRVLARLSLKWDSVNYYWNRWIVFFGEEQQRDLFSRFGLDFHRWTDIALAMLATVALLVLSWLTLFGWLRCRRRDDPVQNLYHKFCARLARLGLERRTYEGPLAYTGRVGAERSDLAGAVNDIGGLYSRLRYAAQPGSADIQELKQKVRNFRPGTRNKNTINQ
ncbi:MAG: DUF3488 and DUF4129 domain-containing transglutaminase family protein [Pseudomonadota bacterium]|nr:DUF3488 and DUF4129 domain-containing transglutaminase family protein [Pseudomonadota bacterium]